VRRAGPLELAEAIVARASELVPVRLDAAHGDGSNLTDDWHIFVTLPGGDGVAVSYRGLEDWYGGWVTYYDLYHPYMFTPGSALNPVGDVDVAIERAARGLQRLWMSGH